MNTRITVACPASLMGNANQLAAALGGSLLDLETFRAPTWTNSQGNLFTVASLLMTTNWKDVPHTPIERPSWDVDGVIDLEAANRALEGMVIWREGDKEAIPTAESTALTAIIGIDGPTGLKSTGLVPLPDQFDTIAG